MGHGLSPKVAAAPPPLLDPAAETIAVDLASLPRGNGETILVVDDDPDLLATAAGQLAGLGYRIMRANNGVAALDALEREPAIRLLYRDVVMPPPWDGASLAREALARRPHLAVLLTSAEHRQVIDPPAELLSKPVALDRLAQAVREALDAQALSPSRSQT